MSAVLPVLHTVGAYQRGDLGQHLTDRVHRTHLPRKRSGEGLDADARPEEARTGEPA
jgi:hypothetical protein